MASQQEDQMKAILDQIQMLGNLPKQIENVREDIKGEVSAIKESLEYSQGQLHTANRIEQREATTPGFGGEIAEDGAQICTLGRLYKEIQSHNLWHP